jgi:CheY-like chemotaxis protein
MTGAGDGDRTIRVLLADDHPVVRAGLRGMLAAEAGIEVAGEAGSGPEAVALARAGGYDVILMDLRMPGGDGVAATEQILAADLLRAFGKLGVSGRTAAVTTAIERGLLPPPGANR